MDKRTNHKGVLVKENGCVFNGISKNKKGIEIYLSETIQSLPFELPDDIYKDMLAFELSKNEHVIPYYSWLEWNKDVKVFVYLQQLNLSKEHYFDFSGYGTIAKKAYQYISSKKWPMVVVGHLFLTDFNPIVSFDKTIPTEYLEIILKSIQHYFKPTICLIKNVAPDLEDTCYKLGYTYTGDDIVMRMDISEFKTYSDYSIRLKKKYLARTEKITEWGQRLNIVEADNKTISQNRYSINKTYLDVIKNAQVKLGWLDVNYFLEMKKTWNENFEVELYYEDQQMVGFASWIIRDDNIEIHYIGLDNDYPHKNDLYQWMLLRAIKKGIEHKAFKVLFGRTGLEAKSMMGAKPEIKNNYIRFKNPMFNLGYKYFSKFWQQATPDISHRNPFRNVEKTLS